VIANIVELESFPSLALQLNMYLPALVPVHTNVPLPFPLSVNLSAPLQPRVILSPSGSLADTLITNCCPTFPLRSPILSICGGEFGFCVGVAVARCVGEAVGCCVGEAVARCVCEAVGCCVGAAVGMGDGDATGSSAGGAVGCGVGDALAIGDGVRTGDGADGTVGIGIGVVEGMSVGAAVCICVGEGTDAVVGAVVDPSVDATIVGSVWTISLTPPTGRGVDARVSPHLKTNTTVMTAPASTRPSEPVMCGAIFEGICVRGRYRAVTCANVLPVTGRRRRRQRYARAPTEFDTPCCARWNGW
jgi:hypothetical protein